MESKASVASTRLRAEVEAHRETRETLDSTIKELIEVMHVNDDGGVITDNDNR